MHKIMSKPITRESFEIDDFCEELEITVSKHSNWQMGDFVDALITHLEDLRLDYMNWTNALKQPTGDPKWLEHCEEKRHAIWKELIRWLPESWLQTRTVTLNYENLLAMCSKGQRRFHKLNEWSGKDNDEVPNFISWARSLPYAQNFIFIDELEIEPPKTDETKIKEVFEAIYKLMEHIGAIPDGQTRTHLTHLFEDNLEEVTSTFFMDEVDKTENF